MSSHKELLAAQNSPEEKEAVGRSYFFVALALLLAASMYPLWNFPYPGMADYPNHLARVAILSGNAHLAWERYYEISHQLVPNLAMEYFVSIAEKFGLDSNNALRIFAGLALVIPVIGTVLLAFSIRKITPWATLLSIPLAFNRYYVWGFLNYTFSLGVGLMLFALWLRIRDSAALSTSSSRHHTRELWRLAGALAFAGGILILLFSHLAGLGIFLVAVYSFELFSVMKGEVGALSNLMRLVTTTLPTITVYACFFQHSNSGLRINYYGFFEGKIAGLLSPIYSYSWPPAIMIVIATIIGFIIMRYRFQVSMGIASGMLVPITGVFIAFIVLPASMMGSGLLDRRLFIFLCFIALASLTIRYSREVCFSFVVLATTLVCIKTSEIWAAWKTTNDSFAVIRKELTAIHPGSKVIQFVVLPSGGNEFPPLRHSVSFAVMDRGAFIPSLFAQPFNGESIAYQNTEGAVFSMGKGGVVKSLNQVKWDGVCELYDYVLITGEPIDTTITQCLEKMAIGENFALFSVQRQRKPFPNS